MAFPIHSRAGTILAPSAQEIAGVHEHGDAGSGVRHTHICSDAEDQFFLVGFPVIHTDDSGVYHALEHLLFTGTSRFLPAGESLLHYLKKLGATWVNGFTTEESVYFVVAAKDAALLADLLRLTLASLFAPTLTRTDFRRELFSVTAEPAARVQDGIILNEMRGALASPIRQVWHAVKKHLYAGTPFAFNAGGNIGPLYQLDLARILRAHAQTFTSQNCFVVSSGPGDGAMNHYMMGKAVQLSGMAGGTSLAHSRTEPPFCSSSRGPLIVSETHTGGANYYYSVAWRLMHEETPAARLALETLAYILLGNLHAPLRQRLIALPYVAAITGLTGFRSVGAGSCFIVTIECKELLLPGKFLSDLHSLLAALYRQGFSVADIDSAIDKVQLRCDEFYESGLPFGAAALAACFMDQIRGRRPASLAAAQDALVYLREHFTLEHWSDLLASLIDRQPTLQLEVVPAVSAEEPGGDINRTDAVADADAAAEGSTVSILSVPPLPQSTAAEPRMFFEDLPGARLYVEQTRSIVHFLSFRNATLLTPEQLDLIQVYVSVVTELGTDEIDRACCQRLQAQVCHQFQAGPSVLRLDNTRITLRVQFYAKLIAVRSHAFFTMLGGYMERIRFDDEDALVFLIHKFARERLAALRGNGIGFALTQADSRNCLASATQNRISGLESFACLLGLKRRVSAGDYRAVAAELHTLHAQLHAKGPAFLVADVNTKDDVAKAFVDVFGHAESSAASSETTLEWQYGDAPVREHWITEVAASSCAISFRVPSSGRDADGLALIAAILSDDYIFPVLRERGGAYHVGARLDRQAGSVQMFSSRTRSVSDDLDHMLASIAWLVSDIDLHACIGRANIALQRARSGLRAVPGSAIAHFSTALHPTGHSGSDASSSAQFTPAELRSLAQAYLCTATFNCVVVARESEEMRRVRASHRLTIRRIEY